MKYKPALYFKFPCVQLNLEHSWYDYFSLNLFFPFIEAGKFIETGTVEESTMYAFNAPTTLSFVKSDIHLGIKVQILGFGFGLLRQNGY